MQCQWNDEDLPWEFVHTENGKVVATHATSPEGYTGPGAECKFNKE